MIIQGDKGVGLRSHTISLELNIIKYYLKGLKYEKIVLKFLGKLIFFFKERIVLISEQYTVEKRLSENVSSNK